METKYFGKAFCTLPLPDLMETQRKFYADFKQADLPHSERIDDGLEAVFREVFPIESYDGATSVEYLEYHLGEPRHTPEECRQLRLTYAAPLKIKVRLNRTEPVEEWVYLGEVPLMIGGGEFIVNGAERVIVTQIQRSPGVDFSVDTHSSGKRIHSCRIIPERGSWIQVEVTPKDAIAVRIDRSGKIAATTLLRALAAEEVVDEATGETTKVVLLDTNADILRLFYRSLPKELNPRTITEFNGNVLVEPVIDGDTEEVIAESGAVLSDFICETIINHFEQKRLAEEEKTGKPVAATEIVLEVIPPRKVEKELSSATTGEFKDRILLTPIVDEATGEYVAAPGTALNQTICRKILDYMKGLGMDRPSIGLELLPESPSEGVPVDALLLNTLAEDDSHSHEEAILSLYKRLRPGTPATKDKAWDFFKERFFDPKRYNFGPIGRFRLNRKFGIEDDEGETLNASDFANILFYILKLRADDGAIDDIDHLENRRVRTIKDLVMTELRNAMVKLRRGVREQMVIKEVDEVQPHQLINATTVSSALEYFFARGELSQVVDQSNPLSQLVHERRLSALGPGGLNRKRAGFEVRDVHQSHYGRVCPVETPEGTNIGLIVSLATYSSINELGFLVTPYFRVENKRIILNKDPETGERRPELVYLRADEEKEHYIAQADVEVDEQGTILRDRVICRYREEFTMCDAAQVTLVDVAPNQMVGISASLIPFLEHDDANRALMGSNMQRQAVPLIVPEAPLVSTGMEEQVVRNSGMVARAREDGTVTYADSLQIRVSSTELAEGERTYRLHKYKGLNDGTTLNQTPMVKAGDVVKKGDPLSEGAATDSGLLALGRNVLVAFLSWEGCNFEDAILVSERVIMEDMYTSVHIEEFSVEIRETKVGSEEITRDIPGVSEAALANLDEDGLVQVGTRVKPGDILVGKIAPKAKSEFSSEEKLLRAIFGRAGEDVKNDSLTVPPGTEGYVIDVSRFSRQTAKTDEEKKSVKSKIQQFTRETEEKIDQEILRKFERIEEALGQPPVNKKTGRVLRIPRARDHERLVELQEQLEFGNMDIPTAAKSRVQSICMEHDRRISYLDTRLEVETGRLKRGDELRPGVLELVKVYVAVKRKLSVGDKMAGRHGNKGVVARILPEEDMPYLQDGTSLEFVLNPLGVPSRMNVGQILETHLGWAAKRLGFRAVTPVFDGATEEEVFSALVEADLPRDGKVELLDGRTGEPFHEKVTVGYMYMLKLHHLVAEKIHARATGPYSLITQQPLGGKARNGGQRFGEMEVWALEAYGAASILQELLTVKSDDVEGRTKIYEAMVKGENTVDPGTPVSFEVLCNEIRGIGLNIRLDRNPLGIEE